MKRLLAEKNVTFYIVNATRLAEEAGLGEHKNSILQAAFFMISGVIPTEQAIVKMQDAVRKKYRSKGEAVVERNIRGLEAGVDGFRKVEVPKSWKNCEDVEVKKPNRP